MQAIRSDKNFIRVFPPRRRRAHRPLQLHGVESVLTQPDGTRLNAIFDADATTVAPAERLAPRTGAECLSTSGTSPGTASSERSARLPSPKPNWRSAAAAVPGGQPRSSRRSVVCLVALRYRWAKKSAAGPPPTQQTVSERSVGGAIPTRHPHTLSSPRPQRVA
eukprot:scaffold59009_cov32-Tisochrysis_lutea.AAC.2